MRKYFITFSHGKTLEQIIVASEVTISGGFLWFYQGSYPTLVVNADEVSRFEYIGDYTESAPEVL